MEIGEMQKLAIFGVPRSGTSWLAQIFNSHPDLVLRFQPLFSYSHKNQLNEQATRAEIEKFYRDIKDSDDPFAAMSAPHFALHPKSFKKNSPPTHICFKEAQSLHIIENMLEQCPELRVMGICRSPLAVLASWIQAPKEFDPRWDVQKEWRFAPGKNKGEREQYFGYEKWKEAMGLFADLAARHPEQFVIVQYDALLHAPHAVMRNLFNFCNLRWDAQVADFIDASRSKNDPSPYSVFKSKTQDNAWAAVLPENIVHSIENDLRGTDLEVFMEGRQLDPATSLYDYLERPKTCAPDDYWNQVRRTVQGKALSEEQISLLRLMIQDVLGFSRKDRLLDLCCGNGALMAPFFSELGGYLGVDMSPVLIGIAQKNFQSPGCEFRLQDVAEFLSGEATAETFTLCSCGGAFQYFSPVDARRVLRLLRIRFTNVRKVFLWEIPDADKAAAFWGDRPAATLTDHTSALGIWHQADELLALGEECGWKAQIHSLPKEYCQSHYRFNLVLVPQEQSCASTN